MFKHTWEAEPDIDEFGNAIIYIPDKIYYDNNCFYQDDGNTRWKIKVTVERLE
jgi:hypothetical protein